jgi:hypothetical protein
VGFEAGIGELGGEQVDRPVGQPPNRLAQAGQGRGVRAARGSRRSRPPLAARGRPPTWRPRGAAARMVSWANSSQAHTTAVGRRERWSSWWACQVPVGDCVRGWPAPGRRCGGGPAGPNAGPPWPSRRRALRHPRHRDGVTDDTDHHLYDCLRRCQDRVSRDASGMHGGDGGNPEEPTTLGPPRGAGGRRCPHDGHRVVPAG